MISSLKTTNILTSLRINPHGKSVDWRGEITKLNELGISDLALFIDSLTIEQRREVYRLIKPLASLNISYVHITSNFEEWELDYLTATHNTFFFGLSLDTSSFAFISTIPNFSSAVVIENPADNKFMSLFTDEALVHAGVNQLCLDVKTLETDRRHHNKKYLATINVLDHHKIAVTQIGVVPEGFFRKVFSPHSQLLTTLSDLHYLKNIPKSYLANLIILELDNSLEEQLEISKYIKSFFA